MKQLFLFCLAILTLVAACSSNTATPSATSVESALAQNLPSPWKIKEFTIIESENTGSKVEPLWKSRFRANVASSEDSFVQTGQAYGTLLIAKVISAGEVREIFGIASAKLNAENWQFDIQLENNPFSDSGQSRAAFIGTTVTLGTAEETKFRDGLASKIGSPFNAEKEAMARALMEMGDDRGNSVLVAILVERIDRIDDALMAGEQVDTGVLFGAVKELGALGRPSAIPSITNSYKYQGFGDTPQTYARDAISKIGPSGLPYLKRARDDL